MGFQVLKVGERRAARPAKFRYRWKTWNKSAGPSLSIYLTRAELSAAGLAIGDSVQFQVGDKEHSGVYALGKGTRNARRLRQVNSRSGTAVAVFPENELLRKRFRAEEGDLRVISTDKKGVIAFAIVEPLSGKG